MNYEEFKAKMLSLFNNEHSDVEVTITMTGADSFSVKYTAMYSNPVDNLFNFGMELVELFGTKAIDFSEEIDVGGCETCDYWSEYGNVFVINKVTKNMDNMVKFGNEYGFGKNIYGRK